jgi:hypothetical protein
MNRSRTANAAGFRGFFAGFSEEDDTPEELHPMSCAFVVGDEGFDPPTSAV